MPPKVAGQGQAVVVAQGDYSAEAVVKAFNKDIRPMLLCRGLVWAPGEGPGVRSAALAAFILSKDEQLPAAETAVTQLAERYVAVVSHRLLRAPVEYLRQHCRAVPFVPFLLPEDVKGLLLPALTMLAAIFVCRQQMEKPSARPCIEWEAMLAADDAELKATTLSTLDKYVPSLPYPEKVLAKSGVQQQHQQQQKGQQQQEHQQQQQQQRLCFNCKAPGHIKADCPLLKGRNAQKRSRSRSRRARREKSRRGRSSSSSS